MWKSGEVFFSSSHLSISFVCHWAVCFSTLAHHSILSIHLRLFSHARIWNFKLLFPSPPPRSAQRRRRQTTRRWISLSPNWKKLKNEAFWSWDNNSATVFKRDMLCNSIRSGEKTETTFFFIRLALLWLCMFRTRRASSMCACQKKYQNSESFHQIALDWDISVGDMQSSSENEVNRSDPCIDLETITYAKVLGCIKVGELLVSVWGASTK